MEMRGSMIRRRMSVLFLFLAVACRLMINVFGRMEVMLRKGRAVENIRSRSSPTKDRRHKVWMIKDLSPDNR